MMNRSKERLLCKPAVDVICQCDTVQTGQLPHAVVVARGRQFRPAALVLDLAPTADVALEGVARHHHIDRGRALEPLQAAEAEPGRDVQRRHQFAGPFILVVFFFCLVHRVEAGPLRIVEQLLGPLAFAIDVNEDRQFLSA